MEAVTVTPDRLSYRRSGDRPRGSRPAAQGCGGSAAATRPVSAAHDDGHVAAELDMAAAGGDTANVSIALRMALSLEGVQYGPK